MTPLSLQPHCCLHSLHSHASRQLKHLFGHLVKPSEARWGAGGKLPAARKLLLLHGSSEVKSHIANTSISAPKGLSIIGWCTHDHYSKDHWLRWSVNLGKSCLLRLVVWKATSGRALLLTLPSSRNLHHHDSLHHQEIRLGSDRFQKCPHDHKVQGDPIFERL